MPTAKKALKTESDDTHPVRWSPVKPPSAVTSSLPWRIAPRHAPKTKGAPVDAHGVFVDGSTLEGPAGLRQVLLTHSELFVPTFAEKLLTYAVGRPLEASDMPAVREIVRRAEHDEYRLSALVVGVATSVPMQMRSKLPATEDSSGV